MNPEVLIVLGSKNDLEKIDPCLEVLRQFDLDYSLEVSSAHRNPERTAILARDAERNGFKVIIAGAGLAAHLPGVIAAHTCLPVIGLPLASGALNGVDSLYSIVQMPPGVPVACMAINGAKNAALFAVQIIGLSKPGLREKFAAYKESLKS
ncbi:5-(carboxyamino)imidazole ribonucleotide mutase [Candidatus Cloacimonadaceae bacterium]